MPGVVPVRIQRQVLRTYLHVEKCHGNTHAEYCPLAGTDHLAVPSLILAEEKGIEGKPWERYKEAPIVAEPLSQADKDWLRLQCDVKHTPGKR